MVFTILTIRKRVQKYAVLLRLRLVYIIYTKKKEERKQRNIDACRCSCLVAHKEVRLPTQLFSGTQRKMTTDAIAKYNTRKKLAAAVCLEKVPKDFHCCTACLWAREKRSEVLYHLPRCQNASRKRLPKEENEWRTGWYKGMILKIFGENQGNWMWGFLGKFWWKKIQKSRIVVFMWITKAQGARREKLDVDIELGQNTS